MNTRLEEVMLLTCVLHGATKCDRHCGRIATLQPDYCAPFCDACWAEAQKTWAKTEKATELAIAKRARRLEQLLRGE